MEGKEEGEENGKEEMTINFDRPCNVLNFRLTESFIKLSIIATIEDIYNE